METITKNTNKLIEEGINEALSYTDYNNLVQKLAIDGGTTGNEQTEAMVNYTKLGARRMKRWDKTVKITPEAIEKIKQFDQPITWLILSESWCGDAAHIIPVLNKIASLNENINIKIILRDKHDALMNEFLTNGGKAIPKLIALDSNNDVKFTYGPRPSAAAKMVNEFKEEHGQLTPEFKEDLQRWYNKDKGQTIVDDLIKALTAFIK